jgi:hypothetical protein
VTICHSIDAVADRPILPEVATAIASYRPRAPEAAGAFARAVVAAAEPPSAARARALCWASSRLGTFGISVGLAPLPEVLLGPSVIERFVAVGCGDLSPAGRRTLRTNLRWLAARLGRGPSPAPPALPRERAHAPYGAAEVAAYLCLADAQPTLARRMRAQGLIAAGAGAGLVGADLARLRGTDVIARSGGLVVCVGGRRPRVVPVRSPLASRLAASARHAGGGWVIGGVDPARHNLTTPLISSLSGGADLARLSIRRLRSTWLAALAERLGIATLLAAAGVSCTQRLGDLCAGLPVGTEAEAVALLGGGD